MPEKIYYPAYASWDKSIDISGALSDTLTLSRRGDGGSAIVKVIFETFDVVLDPAPDSGFLRLWVVDGAAPDAASLCVSVDYNHKRPISGDDWADAPTGDIAVDARPVHHMASTVGPVDIPLTNLDGIRTCPTGFRLFLVDESGAGVFLDNYVVFEGFTGHKPELHLRWAISNQNDDTPNSDGNNGGGGGGTEGPPNDPGDSGDDGNKNNEGDKSHEPGTTRGQDQFPDVKPQFALFAHRLAATGERPVIEYHASLRRLGVQEVNQ